MISIMRRWIPALLIALTSAFALPSCGLIKLPFRVVGAVAKGTAKTGKKAYDASAKALSKSEKEKAAEKKEKELEKLQEQQAEKKPAPAPIDISPATDAAPAADDYLPPPLPGTDYPLPDDAPLPYQD